MNARVFVTGTDTEVGKTFVSCALLKALTDYGKSTCAMKPIASGCEQTEQGLVNEDAQLLMHYSSEKLAYPEVNPFAFQAAIAPHIAAQHSGKEINKSELLNKSQNFLSVQSDFALIEGAGGWRVPISQNEQGSYFFSDYVKDLNIPVILVVAIRLGCINHALLSAEAIQHCGLNLLGWVANFVKEGDEVAHKNISSIESALTAPLLASIPAYKHSTIHGAIEQAARVIPKQTLDRLLN